MTGSALRIAGASTTRSCIPSDLLTHKQPAPEPSASASATNCSSGQQQAPLIHARGGYLLADRYGRSSKPDLADAARTRCALWASARLVRASDGGSPAETNEAIGKSLPKGAGTNTTDQ